MHPLKMQRNARGAKLRARLRARFCLKTDLAPLASHLRLGIKNSLEDLADDYLAARD
ncbi:hypothetical protein COCOBI_pt-2110 (chloroplast) [Coccomyxa sp. Obi]|nr:hypothetical protein COCOBI_pt-2110 [Coccomyxa sp. Obi]